MIINRKRERHKQRCQPGRGHLGNRECTRTGNHPIRRTIRRRHIHNKRHHLGLDTRSRIRRARLIQPALADLMRDGGAGFRRQQRKRLRQQRIQRLRPLRTAQHQQTNRPAMPQKTLRRRRHRGNFGAHRIARDHKLPPGQPHPCCRAIIGEQHPVGNPRQTAVGQACYRILLMHHQRHPPPVRHQTAGAGSKPAHADDHIRTQATQHRVRPPKRASEHKRRLQPAEQPLAAQSAHRDVMQNKTRRRYLLPLKPLGITEPMHLGAQITGGIGHGEGGKHVPAGATGHHQHPLVLPAGGIELVHNIQITCSNRHENSRKCVSESAIG